jgi:hypothetical protein
LWDREPPSSLNAASRPEWRPAANRSRLAQLSICTA